MIRSHDEAWKTSIRLVQKFIMNSIYRVHYLMCSGRLFDFSEEVLEIQTSYSDEQSPPKEFFIAIKQLMNSQCGDLCTSQYKSITLCPFYVKQDEDSGGVYLSYHKFSDNFLNRMESINAKPEVYNCYHYYDWEEED